MHGGELFAESAIVIGLVVAGGWLVWAMRRVADDARMSGTWGDFPSLHEEATTRGDLGGGGPSVGAGRRVIGHVRTHDEGGL